MYLQVASVGRAQDFEAIDAYEREGEQHAAAGNPDAAAELFEEALCLRMRLLSSNHPSLPAAAEALTHASNASASALLRQGGDLVRAERRLQRTLGLLAEIAAGCLKASLAPCVNVTLGNMAVVQQRLGNREGALRCLREAEGLCSALPAADAAATNLSLCSLLSQIGRHREAERHASEAVRLGEVDILALATLGSSAISGAMLLQDKASSLAVAYNNLAVQREFLGQAGDSIVLYEKAVVLAEAHMQPDSALLQKLRESHRHTVRTASERYHPASVAALVAPQRAWLAELKSSTRPAAKPRGGRALSAVATRPVDRQWRERSAEDGRHGAGIDKETTARCLSRELASLLRPEHSVPGRCQAVCSEESSDAAGSEPCDLTLQPSFGDGHGLSAGQSAGLRAARPLVSSSNCATARHQSHNAVEIRQAEVGRATSWEPPLPKHMRAALAQMGVSDQKQGAALSALAAREEDSRWVWPGTAARFSQGHQPAKVTDKWNERMERTERGGTGGSDSGRCGSAPPRTRQDAAAAITVQSRSTSSGPQRALHRARQEAAAVRIQRAAIAFLRRRAARLAVQDRFSSGPSTGRNILSDRARPNEVFAAQDVSKLPWKSRLPEGSPLPSSSSTAVAFAARARARVANSEADGQQQLTIAGRRPSGAQRPPRPSSAGSAPSLSLPSLSGLSGLGVGLTEGPDSFLTPKLAQIPPAALGRPASTPAFTSAPPATLGAGLPTAPPRDSAGSGDAAGSFNASAARRGFGKLELAPEQLRQSQLVMTSTSFHGQQMPSTPPSRAIRADTAACPGPSAAEAQAAIVSALPLSLLPAANPPKHKDKGWSAKLIQLSWKRYHRQRQHARARMLQSLFRAACERRQLVVQTAAVLAIQSSVQGCLVRRRLAHLKAQQLHAARSIQNAWRSKVARLTCDLLKAERESLRREEESRRVQKREVAAIVLQRICRGSSLRCRLLAAGLHASEARLDGDIRCTVRRRLQRHSACDETREAMNGSLPICALRPAGWMVIVSAGGTEQEPFWRGMLQPSEATALACLRHKHLQAWSQEVTDPAGIGELSRALLDNLVVNWVDGQLALHLRSANDQPQEQNLNDGAAQAVDDAAVAFEDRSDESAAADAISAVPEHIAAEAVEVTRAAHSTAPDTAGTEAGPIAAPETPRPSCPAWTCGSCNFSNEVCPDACVLCDAARSFGPPPATLRFKRDAMLLGRCGGGASWRPSSATRTRGD